MIGSKIMSNKHQENAAPTGPLIFTLPASSFVVVLNFDWLDGIHRAAVASKTRRCNDLTIPASMKEFEGGVLDEKARSKETLKRDGSSAFVTRP
jgi:hypothetical protein